MNDEAIIVNVMIVSNKNHSNGVKNFRNFFIMDNYFTLQRYKFFSFGIVPQSVNFFRLRQVTPYMPIGVVWWMRCVRLESISRDATDHAI